LRGVSKDGRLRLSPILRGSPKYAMREHRGGEHLRMTEVLSCGRCMGLDPAIHPSLTSSFRDALSELGFTRVQFVGRITLSLIRPTSYELRFPGGGPAARCAGATEQDMVAALQSFRDAELRTINREREQR
jgi:hypothetical protein